MEESALGRVIDPAAGGFALEALTDQLARQAWDAFAEIERAGAPSRRWVQVLSRTESKRVEQCSREDLQAKRMKIVGVTDFPAGPKPTPSPGDPARSAFRLESLA